MPYDFDSPANRRGTNCYKWDIDSPEQDIIPLWVADMDFQVAPKIVEAIQRRVNHHVYGYTRVPQSFYDAITNWYSRRYNWHVESDWIIYTIGVVPAVAAIIKSLEGENGCGILMQTPAYNCFFSCINNSKCHLVENKLVRTDDSYVIDWDDFEAKAALPDTKIFLLCNPHNPSGRVWTPDELRRMGDICISHGVTVIADEIHYGITMPGYSYTPYASLGDKYRDTCIQTASCSKSFNIAGLQIAYIIASDPQKREAVDRAININETCDVNPFGVEALQAAYNECGDWLDEFCLYIKGNYDFLVKELAAHLPSVKAMRLEGTYLAWVDCRALGMKSDYLGAKLLKEARVRVSPGNIYGEPDGYVRLNLACPREQLAEGMRRIIDCLSK